MIAVRYQSAVFVCQSEECETWFVLILVFVISMPEKTLVKLQYVPISLHGRTQEVSKCILTNVFHIGRGPINQ